MLADAEDAGEVFPIYEEDGLYLAGDLETTDKTPREKEKRRISELCKLAASMLHG